MSATVFFRRCSTQATALVLAAILGQVAWCESRVLAAEDAGPTPYGAHPWRPPFGLDRVGHRSEWDAARLSPLDADAVARPEPTINPVDLGAILVPSDWLLATGGQRGTVDVAMVWQGDESLDACVTVRFASTPSSAIASNVVLTKGRREQLRLALPSVPGTIDRDVLEVRIAATGRGELWHKSIPTMIVQRPPELPTFGAVETKLRYDAPISVRGEDDVYRSLDYAQGWDPSSKDIVVALPNGARFVFWRGASYIPFWAGLHNTGMCYEWAEKEPPPDACDAVEPLMDKELRYGRVRVVESTAARVHVQWDYQSCDLHYMVWGDSAVEDFYFYPDGFGTRVLTLQSDPTAKYEVSELIVLTPQATYPLSVLPPNMVDILFLDGQKHALTFPYLGAFDDGLNRTLAVESRNVPALFRVRLHKDEHQTAIYFSPWDLKLPEMVYRPFFDRGQLVTPVYWGSHWPLARGATTGGAINDRLTQTPCHNSILTWGYSHRPAPLRAATLDTADVLGRVGTMSRQTWAWLIGMTDVDDARLLQWGRSFASPPAVTCDGTPLDAKAYVPERRAIRVDARGGSVTLTLKPAPVCVNPVFELLETPADSSLSRVELDGVPLDGKRYAWDGRTLWLDATLTRETSLRLEFAVLPKPQGVTGHHAM